MWKPLGYTLPDVLTWDYIWEVSEAATAKDAEGYYLVNGQKVMIPFIYKSADNMMIQMLRQKGAGYSNDQGEILLFNDTTRVLLFDIAGHVSTGAFSTFKVSSYPANFLNAGQCIFAIDSTAGSTWMGSEAPLSDISKDSFVRFETAFMPIPQFDPDNPQMISQGSSERKGHIARFQTKFCMYRMPCTCKFLYSMTVFSGDQRVIRCTFLLPHVALRCLTRLDEYDIMKTVQKRGAFPMRTGTAQNLRTSC